MKCVHGVDYPCEGRDPDVGPWTCNPDGSNPNCDNCSPDAWAIAIHSSVDAPCDMTPVSKEAESALKALLRESSGDAK